MEERPHKTAHEHRVVSTEIAGVLLLDQRIDQYLEGSLGLGHELVIFGCRLDECAEHNPVMGWMHDRELHVCSAHGLKADAATPVTFPGIGDGLPEHAESFFPHRREQGLFVSEMTVERAAGDPQTFA